MMFNRTPWLHASHPPARLGVYERQIGTNGPVLYSLWDGMYWRQLRQTPEKAAEGGLLSHTQAHDHDQHRWRGLLNPFLPS